MEWEPPRLADMLPEFSAELALLFIEAGEPELANKVSALKIVSRCGCRDDFCASMDFRRLKERGYNPGYRLVVLHPADGYINASVVEEVVVSIEVLFRDDVRKVLDAKMSIKGNGELPD